MVENHVIHGERRVLVAGRHEDFRDGGERLGIAGNDLQVLPVGRDRLVVVLGGVVRRGQVEHVLLLVPRELGVARGVDRQAEVLGGGVVLLPVIEEHGQQPESRGLLAIDRIGPLQRLHGRIGVPSIEQGHGRVVDRDPHVAAPGGDVLLALGLEPLGTRERRVGAHRVLHFDVIAAEPVPRGRVLILPRGLDRLHEVAVGVAQVFQPILFEAAARRTPQIQKAGVDLEVTGLEIALGRGREEYPALGRCTAGEQRDHSQHRTDSHITTPWFVPRGARRRAGRRAPPRAAAGRGLRPPPERRRIRA